MSDLFVPCFQQENSPLEPNPLRPGLQRNCLRLESKPGHPFTAKADRCPSLSEQCLPDCDHPREALSVPSLIWGSKIVTLGDHKHEGTRELGQ